MRGRPQYSVVTKVWGRKASGRSEIRSVTGARPTKSSTHLSRKGNKWGEQGKLSASDGGRETIMAVWGFFFKMTGKWGEAEKKSRFTIPLLSKAGL